MPIKPYTAEERIARNTKVVESGCWEWTRTLHKNGYASVKFRRRVWMAHRLSYETFVGPIPNGLQIDHLCRNRACVNPAHLEAVSARENTLRGSSLVAANAAKTACKNGHPFTDANTHMRTYGSRHPARHCRQCHAESERKRRARVRASLAVAAVASVALAGPADAGEGHDKEPICHPVEGKGETGFGWNLISPDKASSHIDEATGAGKHTRKDGRTDVYAVNGLCPGQPVPSPTSIPTTVTPSPTTTGGTPSATTTATSTPTSSSSPASPTGPPSVPSSTTTTPTGPSTSPSSSEPTPTPEPSTGSPTPSTGETTSSKLSPNSDKPSPPSPRRSVPSTTDAPPELAHTGARLTLAIAVALLLLAAGSAFIRTARKGARREH